MWASPRLSSSAMTLASLFARLISCSGENGVHGGDPTTQKGSVDLTSLLTLLCTIGQLRSHLRPVAGSVVVRSRLHPGCSVSPPNLRPDASWQILGWENISETSGPFLSYRSSALRSTNSTLMLSSWAIGRCSTASAVICTSHSSNNIPVDRLHTLRV